MEYSELKLEKKYYYNHKITHPEDRRFYLFLLDCIIKKQYVFKYTFVWDDPLFKEEADEAPKIHPTLPITLGERMANIEEVYDALLWDFPEFYYLPSHLGYDTKKGTFLLTPKNKRLGYSEKEKARLDRRLDAIYRKFDGIESGFPLEVAVNDFIIREYDYDRDGESYKGKRYAEIFTVAGLLKRKKAVCSGITRLAQYIFQRRGMDCAVLTADIKKSDKAHAWLAVKIDGQYYHLDITDNESLSKEPHLIQYSSFNITDREIKDSSLLYKPEEFPEIVCSSKKGNYYYRKGLYCKSESDVTELLGKFLSDNRHLGGKRHLYFRVSPRLNQKSVAAGMSKAVRGIKLADISYINYKGYYSVEVDF